jgi:hypothetical protein
VSGVRRGQRRAGPVELQSAKGARAHGDGAQAGEAPVAPGIVPPGPARARE